MNFLLLLASEVAADGTAVLRGRRAEHVAKVLRGRPGQTLRAGLLDGPLGTATVQSLGPDAVVVATVFDRPAPLASDVLVLAVPRPKVLLRLLAHAAALGFGRVLLFRSWRVDPTHLRSRALLPQGMRAALLAGLEQAGRTVLPQVELFPRFRPFIEDVLPASALPDCRFVAHPSAATATADLGALPRSALALALGPEGGLLPFEIEQLAQRGFLPVHCGPHPLRTETALAVLTGQLALLRSQRSLTE